MLIPDGASPSSDVVRADWNPDTGLFEFRDIITMDADTGEDRPRPVAVSAAPDGNAYVVFQRSGTIQRIVDPESPTPTVDLVATTSDGRGASAVAATYGPRRPAVAAAHRRRRDDRPARGRRHRDRPGRAATTVDSGFDLPGAQVVSALTYEILDAAAGTGDLLRRHGRLASRRRGRRERRPRVPLARRSGLPSQVADGLSTVGGFGPRHGGGLLVLDDPAIVMPGEPIGTGRMFSVGATWARITGGPTGATNDTTPTFTLTGEGARQCSVDGGSPQPCTASFTTAELAEGRHTFAVRAAGVPVSEIRRFEVDTTAPTAAPAVVSPAAGTSRPRGRTSSSTRPPATTRAPTSARSRR